jgi:hypothetical protein
MSLTSPEKYKHFFIFMKSLHGIFFKTVHVSLLNGPHAGKFSMKYKDDPNW